MHKITKKEFIRVMTKHDIIFFGVTRRVVEDDELLLAIDNYDKAIKNGNIVEYRKYTEHAKYLESTGGSRLYFDQANTEYSFYARAGVYACKEHNKVDDTEKVMYYMIV